ncbi:LamG-like jellyroll fold domain-containing protein [Flavobacterium sp. GP15]|uniref:LamG-like jellyroll fold domain-containing protein n=1 Tax=Flavobacterium sp. GP15 TaxID=2758567 RepID=UPI00165DC067|nr:LamG-like jellyroll fold domain-containing protein [Flavobacterium sp. GP15]
MIKKLLFLVLLLITSFSYGQAASDYCFMAVSGTYNSLSNDAKSVVNMTANQDDGFSDIALLDFNFTFGGQAYSQFIVSSNGWLSFVTSNFNNNQNYTNSIASAAVMKPILMPLWDDLANTTIPKYETTGAFPNRIFKIEWSAQKWEYNSGSDVMSFQIWLYESTNVIEYHYNRGSNGVKNGSATIGIYDQNDTYLTLNNSGNNPIASSGSFNTNINSKPANGQIYRFTPPVRVSIASTSICAGDAVTFSATPINGGTLPIYQWKVNGVNVGTNSATYVSPALTRGDDVSVAMTSNATSCLSGIPTTSNVIRILPQIAPVITGTPTTAGCSSADGSVVTSTLNNALQFNKSKPDFVNLNKSILSNLNAFTVEGWIKFNKSDLNSSFTSLFGQNDVVEFGFITDTELHLWTQNGGSLRYTYPVSLADNNWHHIAGVGNGANLLLFIDGKLMTTQGSSRGNKNYGASGDFVKIGSGVFTPSGNPFTGQIMKVGMYNMALSESTIVSLASSPTTYTGSEPGLIAGYNFIESSGSTLTSVPAGNNGTLLGSPTFVHPYTYSWTKAGDATFTRNTKNINGISKGDYTISVSFAGASCPRIANFSIVTVSTTWGSSLWSNGNPSANKSIVFNDSYSSTGDLIACDCKVNPGKNVTINSGHTLTLTNGLNTVGALLTIEDTGSLVQINDAAINYGKIKYVRETNTGVRNTDFTYWSSPVAQSKLGGTGGMEYQPANLEGTYFYSFYVDAVNQYWKSESMSNEMIPARGYSIRGPGPINANPIGSLRVTFEGTPNNGGYSIPNVFEGKSYLVGNPYPSALDADQFLIDNRGVLDGTLYFWTHNTQVGIGVSKPGSGLYAYSGDDYATYNLTGGTATAKAAPSDTDKSLNNPFIPNGKIAAGQGFFANTKFSPESNIIKFTNSMRVGVKGNTGTNTQFFKTVTSKSKKTTSIEKNRLWLNLYSDKGAFKQLLVGYITGATNEYDNGYDGETFDGNELADFYSINQETNFAIQGRALPFDASDIVPLGYRSKDKVTMSIDIDQVDGAIESQNIFIEDKMLNVVHDLKKGAYTFTTEAGVFNDRFVLRYTNKILGNVDFDLLNEQVIISKDKKELKIKSEIETIKRVTVFDLLGKKVLDKELLNETEFRSSTIGLSKQIGIVKVTLSSDKVITKKIAF